MDDRSTTAPSPQDPNQDELAIGIGEEVAGSMAALAPGDDYDVDEALAIVASQVEADAEELARMLPASMSDAVEVAAARIDLDPGTEVVIGRVGTLRVEHPTVSRRHVAVVSRPDGLWIRDLDSVNGSWLVRGDDRLRLTGEPVRMLGHDRVVTAGDVELLRVPGGA